MKTHKKDIETVNERVDVAEIAMKLGVTTPAGVEFIRYALANALLMDSKQKDYGPHNIAEFGVFGCLIRMSDKLKRLTNLMNNRKRKAVNESIADSFRDLSNYGIIAQIVDDGKWPTS